MGWPKNDNRISLYPNPAANFLFLDTNFNISKVAIYAINTQKLDGKISNKKEILIQSLQEGFYILELISNDELTFYKNFVKSSK